MQLLLKSEQPPAIMHTAKSVGLDAHAHVLVILAGHGPVSVKKGSVQQPQNAVAKQGLRQCGGTLACNVLVL